MSEQPFHHGRLRAELLDRAERVVRDEGPDALSLRDLARQAGVSHSAPRRHFADRQALLDAVAERGFERLTAALVATAATGDDPSSRFRASAEAYVRFAAREAKLHDLMFAAKTGAAPASLTAAADAFFAATAQILAPEGTPGGSAPDDPRRLLPAVALQGTAALVAAGRLPEAAAGALLDEAARVFFPA